MSKYGSGLRMVDCLRLEKEQIKQAMKGKLECGEDENGFEYAEAPKEECERFILHAYDNVVHHLIEEMAWAHMYTKWLSEHYNDNEEKMIIGLLDEHGGWGVIAGMIHEKYQKLAEGYEFEVDKELEEEFNIFKAERNE